MLMHCFWLLEFKFAFEFKCLIFSLNLSKFRSLAKAPDLFLLEAQPTSRGPSAKVRWRPSYSRPRPLRSLPRPSSSPAQPSYSAPARAAPFPSLAVADRWGPPVIPLPAPSPRRTRTRVRARSTPPPCRLGPHANAWPSALFKEPPPPA